MTSFNEEDLRLLDKTLNIRERLIDSLVEEGLPNKARDIDAFTNVLESIDRSIFSKAKVKLEDSNSKINEESKEILRSLLIELHRGNNTNNTIEIEANEIPSYESQGFSINQGELIEKSDNVTLDDVK